MKKSAFVLAFLALFGWMTAAMAEDKPMTQKYEVVCMKCVAHHMAMGDNGGHGAGHAACAMTCSTKGTDLGLMDAKGNVYVPVDADFKPARDTIKDKAGQTIELTGTVVKTTGITYLKLAAPAGTDPSPSMDNGKMKDGN
jgi:hypothetical protein